MEIAEYIKLLLKNEESFNHASVIKITSKSEIIMKAGLFGPSLNFGFSLSGIARVFNLIPDADVLYLFSTDSGHLVIFISVVYELHKNIINSVESEIDGQLPFGVSHEVKWLTSEETEIGSSLFYLHNIAITEL